MELFKIREEYTDKIREYDRYILSRKKLGINGYLKAIKESSKENMGRKIIEVYEEIIATHNNTT